MATDVDLDTALAQELSEKTIRRTLLWMAIQYPSTLVPLAIAVVGLVAIKFPIYGELGFIDPLIDTLRWILIVGGLVTAAISFYLIYSVRHDAEYARIVKTVMDAHNIDTLQTKEQVIAKLRETLRDGFNSLSSEKGNKALNQLDEQYERLKQLLDNQDSSTASMSSANLPGLADETYREGLNVLAKSLQLSEAIRSTDRERLENQIIDLEKEIEGFEGDDSQAARMEIRKETVRSHQERLLLINQQQLRVDELLFECDRCEASMSRARIEVAALLSGGSEASVGSVTNTLQRTITQAKEVQVELERLGF